MKTSFYILPNHKWQQLISFTIAVVMLLNPILALAGKHRGSTGPEPIPPDTYFPPPSADFGGYVWGDVCVNGRRVTTATISMQHERKEITARPMWVETIDDARPIYMFGTRPKTQLGVGFNSTVTLVATTDSGLREAKQIRLDGGDREMEIYVPFGDCLKMDPPPTSEPTPGIPFDQVVANSLLSAGGYHTCAIVNGEVWCWGRNYGGQLGDGTAQVIDSLPNTRSTPFRVPGLPDRAKSVAAGEHHACALLETGKVYCWGWNYYGNLGYQTVGAISTQAVEVSNFKGAISIAAGSFTTCAIFVDMTAKCWGNNYFGQLGYGTVDVNGNIVPTQTTTPVYVKDSTGTQLLTGIKKISTLFTHMCALVNGGVKCWGDRVSVLGDGVTDGNVRNPSPVDVRYYDATVSDPTQWQLMDRDIVDVQAGYRESCALRTDGTVWCWSREGSYFGEIAATPMTQLPAGVTQIAVGQYFACALTADNRVFCWGSAEQQQVRGQLGPNSALPTTTPVEVTGLPAEMMSISAGWEHACVQTREGSIFCWGSNYYGQLGDGVAPERPLNQLATVTGLSNPPADIATGGFHTCVRTAAAQVECFGANAFGQLGTGAAGHFSATSVRVPGLDNVTAIASGMHHSCAARADGVWCWGRNESGQLGNGNTANSAVPVAVTGFSTSTVALAAGYYHTCALTTDGEAYCWGSDGGGQLGNGSPNGASSTPVQVVDLPGQAVTITAGAEHTCATLTGGRAYCWGRNNYGQLGDGTTISKNAPVAVSGIVSGTTMLAGGQHFTCAIVTGGVKCWGNGHAAQLGNNTGYPYTSTVPVDVVNLVSPAVDLSIGRTHACALLQNGSVSCWGSSYLGERGGDTLTFSQVPITVTGLTSGVIGISDSQFFHTCAWLQDGKSRCWGLSDFGQLGDGIASVQPSPVKVVISEQAKWTYMLYLAGDNDLSPYLNNISRVLDKLPDNSDLNVVVFFDGQEKEDNYIWSTRPGGDYELGLHKWKLSESDTNTGDPQTLVRFVDWARANFPADHFYLSIANHGRGTTGTAWDFQNGTYNNATERLTPLDLHEALRQITQNGTQKLDIIHFDSCLMALFEIAYQVKDFADYMIASENLTAAFYPYDDYSRLVLKNPLTTTRGLAIDIAKAYFNQQYLSVNDQPRTISVLDLSKVDEANTKINALASLLIDNINSAYIEVEKIRAVVQTFDSSPDPTTGEYYTITPDDEYIDLRDFAAKIASAGVDDSVKNAANELTNFLAEDRENRFIVYNEYQTGTDNLVSDEEWRLDGSNGVAIYFPTTKRYQPDYEKYLGGDLFAFTGGNDWDEFLVRYFEALSQPVEPQPEPSLPPVLKPTKPITEHCLGSEGNCLWGTVLLDGVPVTATVTLEKADGTTAVMQAAYMKGSEAMPVYAFSFASGEISVGDSVTLRAIRSDLVREQTIRFVPNSATGEQEVNILLNQTVPPGPPPHPNPEVHIRQATIELIEDANGTESLVFNASAESTDRSIIVLYEWKEGNQMLGVAGSFRLPKAELTPGDHEISVTAFNEAGVKSKPFTVTINIEQPPQPTATVKPTGTPTPTVTPTATAVPVTPTSTPSPSITPTATSPYITISDGGIGAPGSSFIVQGWNFPPNSLITLFVNDLRLDNIPTDVVGTFSVVIITSQNTPEGEYTFTNSAVPAAQAKLIVDRRETIKDACSNCTGIEIPPLQRVLLPLILR